MVTLPSGEPPTSQAQYTELTSRTAALDKARQPFTRNACLACFARCTHTSEDAATRRGYLRSCFT